MEPLIALLTLLAQTVIRQDAILNALVKKGVITQEQVKNEMPANEADAGKRFDQLRDDFFGLWGAFDETQPV